MMLGLDAKAEGQSAVATARRYLVSLCVANLDVSVRWYRNMLGFRETRRLNVPSSSLRISFIELNEVPHFSFCRAYGQRLNLLLPPPLHHESSALPEIADSI